MNNNVYILLLALAPLMLFSGCSKPSETDLALTKALAPYQNQLLIQHTRLPARDQALEDLGRALFFSKTLSGNRDVACVSCHHPYLAGGDKLSLPVGESALKPNLLGPGRSHNWKESLDPNGDGAPNVPRHSPSTFNSVLYKTSMFFDGRVSLLDKEANTYKTPDSRMGSIDASAGHSLLATQTRFPITSTSEMKGFKLGKGSNNTVVRKLLTKRLQTEQADLSFWLSAFKKAFPNGETSPKKLITFEHMQNALAAYQSSQLLINNPWFDYVKGDNSALSEQQKLGAIDFFTPASQGGLDCVSCHTPPFFSDEGFHNIAMIQLGRGKHHTRQDFGRRNVSQNNQDRFKFRTPQLLNVSETAPYGHTGALLSLEATVSHHLDPNASIKSFDFNFSDNPQLSPYKLVLSDAKELTQKVLDSYNKQKISASATPSKVRLGNILAFLGSLTDPCLLSKTCLSKWLPTEEERANNSSLLKAEFSSFEKEEYSVKPPKKLPPILIQHNVAPPKAKMPASLSSRCNRLTNKHANSNTFTDVSHEVGLNTRHSVNTDHYNFLNIQQIAFTGGAAIADINNDCFPDIFYITGPDSADQLFINNNGDSFTEASAQHQLNSTGFTNGATFADINSDGVLDLLVSKIIPINGIKQSENVTTNETISIFLGSNNKNKQLIFKPMPNNTIKNGRSSWSISVADFDGDGDQDIFTNHWSVLPAHNNHLWLNNKNTFTANDIQASLDKMSGDIDFTFTTNFADINNDGHLDLLIAADFEHSKVYLNNTDGTFIDATENYKLSDENGMGATVGDYDNDGDLDWFVSSIWDTSQRSEGNNWGVSGNRLYTNSIESFEILDNNEDVKNSFWGWGSCFADFNNDGWQDIFVTNGFTFSDSVINALPQGKEIFSSALKAAKKFSVTPNKLFMSQQSERFMEAAKDWAVNDDKQGRAVICFDYDRDGDLDIFITSNNGQPSLYRNNSIAKNFINIALAGHEKNTFGVGAKVFVTTEKGTQMQQMTGSGGFLSSAPYELHFGLDNVDTIKEVKVIWPQPNYSSHSFKDIQVNQFIKISAP